MNNGWVDIVRKMEEEEILAQTHGDVPITNPPLDDHPVIVVEGRSWPEITKLCFRTMTYGEFIEMIAYFVSSEDERRDLAAIMWSWANEPAEASGEKRKSKSRGIKDDS